MKTLFILRHAKASGPGSASTDFDRPLNERGRTQAADVGTILRARAIAIEGIVASPARRVVETLAGLREALGSAVEQRLDPRVYSASPEALAEVIREAGDSIERLLLVGHNPGLQFLLLDLAQEDSGGHRAAVAAGFPTAAMVELRLEVNHWRDVAPRSGRIISLVRGRG